MDLTQMNVYHQNHECFQGLELGFSSIYVMDLIREDTHCL